MGYTDKGPMAASTVSDLSIVPGRLGREELIRAYRIMYLSRRIDDREIVLKRQQKIYFQVSGAGHEAIQTAAGMLLRPGHDWFFPYYRDRALCLALGVSPKDMLLQAVGSEEDTASGGRQMPSHWSSPSLHIVSPSSATGTQFTPSVGCAHAERFLDPASDAVTLVSSGEGATSEGEFWESLNAACLERLPLIYLVQDNGYAISVPVERQSAGGNIARLVQGFLGLKVLECDGTDFLASYATMAEAIDVCRRERGPVLVHALCTRPYSHSLSDDEKLYKSKAEREAEAIRDPLVRFPEWLTVRGHYRCRGPRNPHRFRERRASPGHRVRAESSAASTWFCLEVSVLGSRGSDLQRLRHRAHFFRRTTHHGGHDQPDFA